MSEHEASRQAIHQDSADMLALAADVWGVRAQWVHQIQLPGSDSIGLATGDDIRQSSRDGWPGPWS